MELGRGWGLSIHFKAELGELEGRLREGRESAITTRPIKTSSKILK